MFSINQILTTLFILTICLMKYCTSSVDISSEVQPCFFNQLCTCSRSFGDLGNVQCHDIEMKVVPFLINQSHVYKLSFRRNEMQSIEENSFASTGLYGLEISENLLTSLKINTFLEIENSLRELNLQSNLFTSIPIEAFQNLERLQTLNLNHNLINRLPSGRKFPEKLSLTLKHLLLSDNCLIFIDQYAFSNFKSLEYIDLSENSIHLIHELAFSPFNPRIFHYQTTPLTYLNLAHNRLKSIPFKLIQNLQVLQILILNNNQIRETFDSAFSSQTLYLDELHLESNEIDHLKEMSLRNFRKINKTFLSFNPIQQLPKNVFKDVEINQIFLVGCQLANISSEAWNGLEESLKHIDLSLNNLIPSFNTGLIFLNNASFASLENLKSFTLNDNSEYYRLNPLSFTLSQNSLQEFSARVDPRLYRQAFSPLNYELQFKYIRKLSLTNLHYENHLTKIDLLGYGGYNLEYLDLSSANIEDITFDAFTPTPSLKLLNLSYNYITRLDSRVFTPFSRSLQVLDFRSGLWTKHLECNMFFALGSLLTLNLMDNDLASLSSQNCFTRLKHLQTLILSFNSLSSIDPFLFSSLSNLVYLLLSHNQLSVIESYSFSQLHHLTFLDLSYNYIYLIKSFAFNGLNTLSELNLEGNDIEYIESEAFINLPRVKRINLSFNRIKSLEIEAFDQIGTMSTLELQLNHNLIGQENEIILKLSHKVANSFEIIDFSNNNITFLNSSYLQTFSSTLTHLLLENNNLKMITSSCVANLKRLQKLSFKNNQIESLVSDSFKQDFLLQILDLSFNFIASLPGQLFEDSKNLRIVYLGSNQLQTIPNELFEKTLNLEILDLSNNQLSSFPVKALTKVAENLRTLNLAQNRIKIIKKENFQENLFKGLLNLDLSGNFIKQIQSNAFEEMSQLISLDLSSNQLHILKENVVTGLDNLKSLNLANTQLEELPNFNLKIKHLNVSNNLLRYIPIYFRNLSMLESLDISSNRLSLIPNNIWHILPNLRNLDISNNQVTSLANDSFIGLQKLEELRIKNLSLVQLQYGLLKPLQTLQTLHLSTYPNIDKFEIGKLLTENNAITELLIELNQTFIKPNQISLSYLKFPKKLKKLKITGSKLEVLEPGILQNIQSDTLQLTLEQSNVSFISSQLFQNIGQVRNLMLNVKDNSIQAIEDFFEQTPALSKIAQFNLKSFYGSNNPWVCDCRLAWLRDWMKDINKESFDLRLELEAASLNNYHHNRTLQSMEARLKQVNEMLKDLRDAKCKNTNKTLLKAFSQELKDCKRGRNFSYRLRQARTLPILLTFFYLSILFT